MNDHQKNTVRLVMCALFAALLAVCSQIQIPLPVIPINLALFAVHLAGLVLGPVYGTLAVAVYILMGLFGLPVFAGFMGGPGVLFGKTGGYIIGYLFCAAIVGALAGSKLHRILAMVLGVAVCYVFGTAWFMGLTGAGLLASLAWCVWPFLPGDAVKILLAAWVAPMIRRILTAE